MSKVGRRERGTPPLPAACSSTFLPLQVVFGTKWQLLNQPGFANATNLPLTAARVTLSVIDGVTFQK